PAGQPGRRRAACRGGRRHRLPAVRGEGGPGRGAVRGAHPGHGGAGREGARRAGLVGRPGGLPGERMQPLVTQLVERDQRDGKLRPDLRPTDILFIEFMLSSAAGYAEPVNPELWRRYLTLITDALRPAREGPT